MQLFLLCCCVVFFRCCFARNDVLVSGVDLLLFLIPFVFHFCCCFDFVAVFYCCFCCCSVVVSFLFLCFHWCLVFSSDFAGVLFLLSLLRRLFSLLLFSLLVCVRCFYFWCCFVFLVVVGLFCRCYFCCWIVLLLLFLIGIVLLWFCFCRNFRFVLNVSF